MHIACRQLCRKGSFIAVSEPLTSICPYLRAAVVRVPWKGKRTTIEIPLIRCHLADTMLERLKQTEEGKVFASLLTIPTPNGEPRALHGPDMEPPTPTTCTCTRQQQSCQPCFEEMLRDRSLSCTLPDATS